MLLALHQQIGVYFYRNNFYDKAIEEYLKAVKNYELLNINDKTIEFPEQVVFAVLVLMLSIASENVTEMDVETEVMLSEFDGEVEITVGRVVSISNGMIPSVADTFDASSVTVIVQLV